MSYILVNHAKVKSDIKDGVEYYKEISTDIAKQFLFRIREAKEYILRSPVGFQVKYNNVRTLMLRQFPYHIHYLIDDSKKQIVILGIINSYKNPADFSKR